MIGFRPSASSLAILKAYMKEHNIKSKSKAVNEILEAYKQPFSEEVTGTSVACPLRPMTFELFSETITINTDVDTSVCKGCSKYPCETWEGIFSERRLEEIAKVRRPKRMVKAVS